MNTKGAEVSDDELDNLASRAGFVVNMMGQIVRPAPSEDARQPLQIFADLLLNAERDRCGELAAPEHIPFSDDEWRVRCEVRCAILAA